MLTTPESAIRAENRETLDDRRGPRVSAQETTWPRWTGTAQPHDAGGELACGTRIGPYRILEPVGRGGMATVYLAARRDGELSKRVAIKVMSGRCEAGLAGRFRSERQVLADLDHPNVARFLDGGTAEDGRPYLVMEFVDGLPIDEHCDSRQLSVAERLELLEAVCRAVDHAHRHHVVHRDIKPRNILVTGDGVVKLLDFGIAKLLPPRTHLDPVDATCTGLQPMTPGYASPEQICGEDVTPASDVYALGLLAYKLLTDRLPFGEPSGPKEGRGGYGAPGLLDWRLRQMERLLRGDLPVGPSAAVTGRKVDRDLDAIVLKALALEPRERYASAAALADDIRRHLDGRPVTARRGSFVYRLMKWLRRHRLAAVLAALLLMAFVFFSVALARQSARLEAAQALIEQISHGDQISGTRMP